MIFNVTWDTLIRGYPIAGERCEIAGVGPVPVSVVRDILATGDPFLSVVVTKGVDVVNVAHLNRQPTAHQRTALDWLNPACTVVGCATTALLQIDHRADWANTKITLLALLDRYCTHHHNLKTHQRWGLVPGRGKRAFVPPDDPRHPDRINQTKDPPQTAAS